MEYIIDFNPYIEEDLDNNYYSKIEQKISEGDSITENEAEKLLNVIMYLTRKKINPQLDNYDYKCDLAQSIIYQYFTTINANINNCSTLSAISPKTIGHNFSIVTLNVEGEDKQYLLDPTYIQFFKKENCTIDKYVIFPSHPNNVLIAPDPGYFIKDEDKEAAEFILKYGYIELTPEYAKMYGDSFYNTKQGVDFNPYAFKELPSSMYLKTFTMFNETVSTPEAKLKDKDLIIAHFNKKNSK